MTHKPEKDIAEILNVICQIMQSDDKSEDNIEAVENGLDYILELVYNIDYANDFIKMGGVSVVLRMLGQFQEYSEVLASCCEVLGTVCQNNPKGQDALNLPAVFAKIMALNTETAQDNVYVKAVYTISCLVRSHPPALATFLSCPFADWLSRVLRSGRRKAQLKAVIVVRELLQQGGREKLEEHKCLETLLDILGQEKNVEDLAYDTFRDHAAGVVFRWCTQ